MAMNPQARRPAGQKTRFGRIGVLMGGPSTEREISLKSGMAVYNSLKDSGLNAEAIDIETDDRKENIKLLKSRALDCVFLALHGRFGEDGQIQRILETLKIPYTGSGVLASGLAMDKIVSRRIFKRAGLYVPQDIVLNAGLSQGRQEELIRSFGLPLVIKPSSHGSSIGLSIVREKKEMKKAILAAFKFDRKVIIEEYIKGRELTVGILSGRALPVIEIIPKRAFFDYTAKYQKGLTDYVVPALIPQKTAKKVRQAALMAHRLLGCFGCSRVDIILDEINRPVILEVNTIPGLTDKSLLPKAAKSVGIGFSELCLKLLNSTREKTKV